MIGAVIGKQRKKGS